MTEWTRYANTALATIGWALTTLTLVQYTPVLAVGTVLLGLLAWVSDRPAAAYAVTQIGIVASAREAAPVAIAVLEVGPLLLLLVAVTEDGLSLRTTVAAVVASGVLVGQTLAVFVYTDSLIAAAVGFLTVASVCSYAVHRYERVALGLVSQS